MLKRVKRHYLDNRANINIQIQSIMGEYINLLIDKCIVIENEDYCLAKCHVCNKSSMWVEEKMVYPFVSTAPQPHSDMPGNIRKIYEEARNVVQISPRSAAVLIRVLIEELTKELGETEGSLHQRIINLKEQGLTEEVVDYLISVKTITNELGAHAGALDINNKVKRKNINKLFVAVNIVIDETISRSKNIRDLSEFSSKIKTLKSKAKNLICK